MMRWLDLIIGSNAWITYVLRRLYVGILNTCLFSISSAGNRFTDEGLLLISIERCARLPEIPGKNLAKTIDSVRKFYF